MKEQLKKTGNGKNVFSDRGFNRFIFGLLMVLAIGIYQVFFRKKKGQLGYEKIQGDPEVESWLEPVSQHLYTKGNEFYVVLNKQFWSFLSGRFGLSGSGQNKLRLSNSMKESGISRQIIDDTLFVISHCETGIFTGTDPELSKEALLNKAEEVIQHIYTPRP